MWFGHSIRNYNRDISTLLTRVHGTCSSALVIPSRLRVLRYDVEERKQFDLLDTSVFVEERDFRGFILPYLIFCSRFLLRSI